MRRDQVERLVDAWQAGADREESFRRLFEAFSPCVRAFFLRRGFAPERSEDLVQDTFLSVFKGLDQFRREAPFETWLFELATNASRKALRRGLTGKRNGTEVSLDAEDHQPQAVCASPTALRYVLAKEDLGRVLESIEDLPEQMRRCMKLYLRHGSSAGQVASLLKISPSTVKVQVFRARRRLSRAPTSRCSGTDPG